MRIGSKSQVLTKWVRFEQGGLVEAGQLLDFISQCVEVSQFSNTSTYRQRFVPIEMPWRMDI